MITQMSGNETPTQSRHLKREYLQYQSTPDGDVRVLVESPLDAAPDSQPKLGESEAPTKKDKPSSIAHHTRNLSAHFYDATNLSDGGPSLAVGGDISSQNVTSHNELQFSSSSDSEDNDCPRNSTSIAEVVAPLLPHQPSPTVGQKHRRVFSGGVSNPVVAHRRINSGGNTAVVNRGGKSGVRPSPRRMSPLSSLRISPTFAAGSSHHRFAGHRREDSTGLDMLSAAADASKQELADAAGSNQPPPPPPPTYPRGARRSPPSSSQGARSHQYNLSPTSFSSLGSASPSQYAYHARGGYNSQHEARHYQQHYPSQHYYHHPPPPQSSYFPAPRAGYPVQYAPPRGGSTLTSRQDHCHLSSSKIHSRPVSRDNGSRSYASAKHNRVEMPPPAPPVPPSVPSAGTTTGSQTFVTAISVGEGNKTIQPTSTSSTPSSGHHRKMSSFTSSLGAFIDDLSPDPTARDGAVGATGPEGESPGPGFLQNLDDGDKLLQQLSTPVEAPSAPSSRQHIKGKGATPPPPSLPPPVISSDDITNKNEPSAKVKAATTTTRRYMSGGTSKRIRRKCTVAECTNRVVQGGLCIAHGAKRKQCSHPGCTKNVKKAGLCSTHGPARKKCEYEGCTKVAVQGGRCIAHGAKKKLCLVGGCPKQAILAGMCKKHHDENKGSKDSSSRSAGRKGGDGGGTSRKAASALKEKASIAPDPQFCVVIGGSTAKVEPADKQQQRSHGHQRGLSIFTDMTAVDTILGGAGLGGAPGPDALRNDVDVNSPGNGHEIRMGNPSHDESNQLDGSMPKPAHHTRGLSIFTEDLVAESIIQNPSITDTSF